MDDLRADSSSLPFAEYAKPFFVPETCSHFIRLRQEGHSIGLQHLSQCRAILMKHLLKDEIFSGHAIAKTKRGDLLDLRRRLQASGMGLNTVNNCIATAKTILSEACFRGDIETNPGSEVGEIKYEKQVRGILSPKEVGSLFRFLHSRTLAIAIQVEGAVTIKPGA